MLFGQPADAAAVCSGGQYRNVTNAGRWVPDRSTSPPPPPPPPPHAPALAAAVVKAADLAETERPPNELRCTQMQDTAVGDNTDPITMIPNCVSPTQCQAACIRNGTRNTTGGFVHFVYNSDHFTKTGSGQTLKKEHRPFTQARNAAATCWCPPARLTMPQPANYSVKPC